MKIGRLELKWDRSPKPICWVGEKPKKIKLVGPFTDMDLMYWEVTANKLNELIDAVNEMREK